MRTSIRSSSPPPAQLWPDRSSATAWQELHSCPVPFFQASGVSRCACADRIARQDAVNTLGPWSPNPTFFTKIHFGCCSNRRGPAKRRSPLRTSCNGSIEGPSRLKKPLSSARAPCVPARSFATVVRRRRLRPGVYALLIRRPASNLSPISPPAIFLGLTPFVAFRPRTTRPPQSRSKTSLPQIALCPRQLLTQQDPQ